MNKPNKNEQRRIRKQKQEQNKTRKQEQTQTTTMKTYHMTNLRTGHEKPETEYNKQNKKQNVPPHVNENKTQRPIRKQKATI